MTPDNTNPQVQLFQLVKSKVAPHLSMVEEVAGLLGISTDSAYRRIRGEKPLMLDEVLCLCRHYGLSLDGLAGQQEKGYLFSGYFVQPSTFKFDVYLNNVVQNLKQMCAFGQRKLYYLAKDIPLFHHFHFRELAAFKYYFWMKTLFQSPDFLHKKFSFDDYPEELFSIGRTILEYYNQMQVTELWNIENINSTVRQIEFYHEAGTFINDNDIYRVYEAFEKLINHIEEQAAAGYQFFVEDPQKKKLASYELYYNEVILGDSSILVELDGHKVVFLTHSVGNFMMTRDLVFCENMSEHVHNLMRKSTLISSVSERERSRFFNYLRRRIAVRMQRLRP